MRPWVFLLLLVIEVSGAAERLATQRPYKRGEAMAGYKRPAIPFPEDNRYSREREALGRKLFFDPRLSGARNTSCATCHNPGLAWGDGLARAIGAGGKPLRRRTPTILNSGWGDLMFWDGRAESLEEQVLGPMQSADEMNLPLRELVPRVLSIPGYRPLFEKAYPGAPLTAALVAKAIATFERTVVSEDAPFDRWIGGDQAAIPEAAKRGFDLFHTKAGCSKCHLGWTFTDEGFHDIGTTGPDRGR
ncbi:MAG: cytochrome-c peroxidase, partial [Bryobacteraceae bacterium]